MSGQTVWEQHGYKVVATLHGDGLGGDVTATTPKGEDLWLSYSGGRYLPFSVPKKHWWQRSLQKAVFRAIETVQQHRIETLEAERQLEVARETVADLREVLP